MNLEKNDVIEVTIEALGCNGEGVARVDGLVVFLRGALPGERVRAKVIVCKPSFCVAIVQEIVSPSPDRATPRCAVFGKCGGCTLQHLSYAAQLRAKKAAVEQTFYKVAGLRVTAEEGIPSARPYGYRNKLSLPVRGADAQVGFFAAASHRLIPVDGCPIQFDGNDALIALFRDWMTAQGLSGYDEASGRGDVRHLVARQLGGVLHVTVVTPQKSLPQLAQLNRLLQARYGADGFALWHNVQPQNNNVILGEQTRFAGGRRGSVTVDGLAADVHPKAFFQINDDVRRQLYADVAATAEGGEVIDAYSGAGFLTALLARKATRVTAVEREAVAVESARRLFADNRVSNATAVCGDCADVLPRLCAARRDGPLQVVLDPPRSGCDRRVLQAVVGSGAQRIVYVSCNPATLARDVKALIEGGYDLTLLRPYDMFPQTMNVETLCVLSRRRGTAAE